jgi:subtilase family serine protease
MQQDLDHFSDVFGLPHTTIQFVYPNGKFVNPLTTDDQVGWAGETTLDLEWAHAIAPDATLVNVISNSSETTGMAGMQDLFNGIHMAAMQYPNSIMSMSFGTGEATFSDDEAKTYLRGEFHKILEEATAGNITFLASAGDSGSAELNLAQTSMSPFADASYPATDPLITAVGGTALEAGWLWNPEGTTEDYWTCQLQKNPKCPKDFLSSVDSPGNVLETVWKEDWALAAGGGGVSTVFDAPDFQSGLDANIRKITKGHRAIPDVSLNAAINGGVEVYASYVAPGQKPGPTWQSVGGTSCAAPEVAALVALAGQKASDDLGRQVGVGLLNDILYTLGDRDFSDIVSHSFGADQQVVIDNNALYFNPAVLAKVGATRVPPVAVPGYSTTPGFDMATGLGSPRAVNFVLDVANARVASDPIGRAILSQR